ncbi:type III-B CRISPR-associated protein Cas10/Cmr2 [Thermoflavimicrobium daqui]|uniref:Type III-B CRISPR-associated protein Cas10/Cmr2 n=1 Tax=Thermoflavimicrobium daqui TaxID=2137476 RepID=A0A364K5Z3_9BACL|nr:type III-B CRISPR-associated protein Cas10/Cmr2 [Thermoflavimicrobium daqui]RAL25610.1 type III-B CRISPR-associated protein Cas10/Cmr2 [Thermoflavimicrobium daqui]
MSQKTHFHFTIGPVQGFVAQSRRTRDLLASSFLLSYLSGHAMMAAIREGCHIVFPYVHERKGVECNLHDPLLQAIDACLKGQAPQDGPWIGSLPNRFKAEVPEGLDPIKSAQACQKAVVKAWKRVSEAVWNYTVAPIAHLGQGTRAIWDRQTQNFWEMAWVIGEEEDLLDRRKNWRSYIPPEEPGDKCTLMGSLQEVSGHFRGDKQRKFWKSLRNRLKGFDLGLDERLSTIGLIKRFFVKEEVTKAAIGWDFPDQARLFPSTAYIAIIPWLAEVVKQAPQEAQAYMEAARLCKVDMSEYPKRFGLPHLSKYGFTQLQGQAFYQSYMENDRNFEKGLIKERQRMKESYQQLIDAMDKQEPNPYYALILMDGDRLGALLQKRSEKEGKVGKLVSQSLAQFTEGIELLVSEHQGVTIYAGGDDVLAMVPMEQALAVVVKLREKYMTSFSKIMESSDDATISAAIVYAHYRAPLQEVLQHAHQLLDKEAKEKSGRNSLAISVWKSSGIDLTWSAPWEIIYDQKSDHKRTVLEKLAIEFQSEQALVSSSFLYKLRELYEQYPKFKEDQQENREILLHLITADLLRIQEGSGLHHQEAEEKIKALLNVCFRSRYEQKELIQDDHFSIAGALLVRFLGQRGGEFR